MHLLDINVHDAYLAAFAEAGGFAVVSFDKGFARYQRVHCTIL
jgi:predicted nucleic acid-binding protein